jgi:hypothetical protein
VQRPRFIFLAIDTRGPQACRAGTEDVLWMIVSPNNRQLGRSAAAHADYADCLSAVQRLRAGHRRAEPAMVPAEEGGRWSWRLRLDGVTVARSSRSYLRTRECQYNLARFLEAVATAVIVEGVRPNRVDRRTAVRQPHPPAPPAPPVPDARPPAGAAVAGRPRAPRR